MFAHAVLMKSNSMTNIIGARSLNLTVVNLKSPISNYHLGLIMIDKIRKLKKLTNYYFMDE